MIELGKRGLGLTTPDAFVACALYYPDNEIDQKVYELYCHVGRPAEGKEDGEGRDPYCACVGSAGHMAAMYTQKIDAPWIPWEVPEWALDMARTIRVLAQDAECIGREKGHDLGLKTGKAFVMQLATGELAPNEFVEADGRDTRRLNRKKW